MRIIAGERKGFPIITPEGLHTRPTLSRVRESMFSILGNAIPDAMVWDLFAGAGTLGLEALSRGARSCRFVENHKDAIACLTKNVEKLKYENEARIENMHAMQWIDRAVAMNPFIAPDIILADPPYDPESPANVLKALKHPTAFADTLLILQTSRAVKLTDEGTNWKLLQQKKYGTTLLWIYRGVDLTQALEVTDSSVIE